MSIIASWPYFGGTPFVVGMDYFTHLIQADIVKTGIMEGTPIPAYHNLAGSGTTFIRYQAMLTAQFMGWLCYFLQSIFDLSDTSTVMYAGRISGILLNVCTGLAFLYGAKKLVAIRSVAVVGATAYVFGWQRWAVLVHSGALQRAGALVFYPICFALWVTAFSRKISRKEQLLLGAALSGCVLAHPAHALFLAVLLGGFTFVEGLTHIFKSERRKFVFEYCRQLVLPIVLALGFCAWYLIPLFTEKNIYGQYLSRSAHKSSLQVSWCDMLPLRYLQEFVDRQAWFSNLIADPQHGGSHLANVTGVNSAYLGMVVIFLAFAALLLRTVQRQTGTVACKIAIVVACMLGIIFWKGLRYHILYSLAHQVFLPCRWLEPLYFAICILVVFGTLFIWRLLQKLLVSRKWLVSVLTSLLAIAIAFDFATLLVNNKYALQMYMPQKGTDDPLGIADIHRVFDSYDMILQAAKQGNVLDIPYLNFDCNRLYHRLGCALSEEKDTEGLAARRYTHMLFYEEIPQVIERGLNIDYANAHVSYSISQKDFVVGRAFHWTKKGTLQMQNNWCGIDKIQVRFQATAGRYRGLLIFPLFLPARTKLIVKKNGSIIHSIQFPENRKYRVAIPFIQQQNTCKDVLAELVFDKRSRGPLHVEKPFAVYDGPGLAYRLALLNVRFIAINRFYYRFYYQTQIDKLHFSSRIPQIYQSPDSVLFENSLCLPFLFPQQVYHIDSPRPWDIFNGEICHHPNYNPHIASFCYGPVDNNTCKPLRLSGNRSQLAEIFSSPSKPVSGSATVEYESLESTTFLINMRKPGFFFPSIHFHPNLRALLNDKPIAIYPAQAGLIALHIPKGTHRLKIYYHHPWYDYLGKYISLIAIITFIFSYWQFARKNS